MVAVRDPTGTTETLEARSDDDAAEAELTRRLVAKVRAVDPDVIENHNLHGFGLPFLDHRARILGVPLALGRIGPPGLRQRAARRGTASAGETSRRVRFVAPGRELIDTLDAVLRYDFAARAAQESSPSPWSPGFCMSRRSVHATASAIRRLGAPSISAAACSISIARAPASPP